MQKVALITGGTSGLGKAMANSLAQDGYMVYAAGRNTKNNSNTTNIHQIYVDVTNSDTIKSAVNSIIMKHGTIDMLVNCAGIGIAAAIEEIPVPEIQEAFDINLFGTIRVIQEVVPHMRKAGAGKIVNVSSIGGRVGLPFQGIYSSTKFAMEGLTEALSIELKPFGIQVCLLLPGDYNTNVSLNRKTVVPEVSSPYEKRLEHFFNQLSTNIDKGLPSNHIEKAILKIAKSKKIRLRYKSARFYERVTPLARNVVPARLFERILAIFYGL